MKVKQKMKKFFTLQHRANDGFTLVELVIVIAILAILAGVAVPAYSGYIKKAEEAKDQLLIAAVNEAFVSPCLEHNVYIGDVSAAAIRVSAQKVYGLSSFSANNAIGVTIDMISNSFDFYYMGNENAEFVTEGVQSLQWVAEDASFKLSETAVDARVKLANGKTIVVTDEQMKALAESGLINLGYDGMKSIMDGVYGSAETLVSLLGNSSEYFTRLSNAIVANGLMSAYEADQVSRALRGESSIYSKEEAKTRAANAMALCAAMEIADPNTNIDTLMNVDFGSSTVGIMSAYTSGIGGSAATAALAMQYAVTSSYAQQHPDEIVSVGFDLFGKRIAVDMTMEEFLNGTYKGSYANLANAAAKVVREDPAMYMNTVESSAGYQAYINDTSADSQYQKDITGMSTALGILGSNVNKDNVDGVINVTGQGGYLDKGIDSDDTKDLIDTVLNTAAQGKS